jgi:hypothetical protein
LLSWLFFTLIDTEVSLRAGCTNEFVTGSLEILKEFHPIMRFSAIKFFMMKILSIMTVADQ